MSDIETVRIRRIGPAHVGALVRVRGWLFNKPGGKGRYFLWLRDGSGMIQAVAEQAALPADVWERVEAASLECSLEAVGEVRAHPKQEGVFELGLVDLRLIGAAVDYPIGKKEHGVEFLMKNRHLWIRGKKQSAILRIRSEVHKAWSDFFYERGFYRVDTPIFTPNACEGTTTLFEVDYHGDTVYLAQSGQLYNEADIMALGQVYCFGPTFRAEKSKTRRHLLEFWMLEMEAAFYDFDQNLKFQEEMLAFTVKRVLDNCLSELRDLGRDPAKLEPATHTPYPRLRYGSCIELINRDRFERLVWPGLEDLCEKHGTTKETEYQLWLTGGVISKSSLIADETTAEEIAEKGYTLEGGLAVLQHLPFRWGEDFGAPDEAAIGACYDRPVFVTNFPIEIKGFYFKDELGADGEPAIDPVFAQLKAEAPHLIQPGSSGHTVLGADLIGSEGAGEIIGGSQREDDLLRLEAKIAHHKLPREFFQWYVDTRLYGGVPHSGFGIGLERTLCWLCGGSDNPVHIREVITFPRMLHQFEP
jgi:asparaginyl-tRNA synthetase